MRVDIPAIKLLVLCLDTPKTTKDLLRCGVERCGYRSEKEAWLDLQLLRALGLVYNNPFTMEWELSGRGHALFDRLVKRLRRGG